MVIESFSPTIATSIGGGFFAGILIGWALKKVTKIFAIISGFNRYCHQWRKKNPEKQLAYQIHGRDRTLRYYLGKRY